MKHEEPKKEKAAPEIYIKGEPRKNNYGGTSREYCKAHIRERVRGGSIFRYLQWRDGEKIGSLYLGNVRNKCQ